MLKGRFLMRGLMYIKPLAGLKFRRDSRRRFAYGKGGNDVRSDMEGGVKLAVKVPRKYEVE